MTADKDKKPRQWMDEILAEPSLEKRREILSRVPANLLPIVKTHVKIFWGRKKTNAAK